MFFVPMLAFIRNPTHRFRGPIRAAVGFCVGSGMCVGYLILRHVPLMDMFRFTYEYHYWVSKDYGFTNGFIKKLIEETNRTPLLWFCLFSGLLSAFIFRREFWRQHWVALAFALSSLSMLILFKLPFDHYVFNFYMFQMVLFSFALFRLFETRHGGMMMIVIGVAFVAHAATALKYVDCGWNTRVQSMQMEICNEMLARTPRNSFVVAAPALHPIFRKDATYSLVYTPLPDGGDTSDIMERHFASYDLLSEEGQLQQLETNARSWS